MRRPTNWRPVAWNKGSVRRRHTGRRRLLALVVAGPVRVQGQRRRVVVGDGARVEDGPQAVGLAAGQPVRVDEQPVAARGLRTSDGCVHEDLGRAGGSRLHGCGLRLVVVMVVSVAVEERLPKRRKGGK